MGILWEKKGRLSAFSEEKAAKRLFHEVRRGSMR
jgi:hypothetical protein